MNLHVFDEIHVGALWQCQVASLHVERGVGKDEKFASETEILLVVGDELKVIAEVAIDENGVFDVEAVERDGVFADGRHELVVKQSDLVVVDVDVGEKILQNGVEDVARLDEVVDARRIDAAHDFNLVLRVASIEVFRHGFIDRQRQNQFAVVRAGLDLVEQPFPFADRPLVEQFEWVDVVHRKGDFLVAVVLVEIVVFQVGALLRGDDAAHQFDGGIVFPRIFRAFFLDNDFVQLFGIGFQLDVEARGRFCVDENALRLVTDGRKREVPTVVPLDGISTVGVAADSDVVALVRSTRVEQCVACLCVGDNARDLG